MKFLVTGKGDVSSVQVTAYSRSILMDQENAAALFRIRR